MLLGNRHLSTPGIFYLSDDVDSVNAYWEAVKSFLSALPTGIISVNEVDHTSTVGSDAALDP